LYVEQGVLLRGVSTSKHDACLGTLESVKAESDFKVHNMADQMA